MGAIRMNRLCVLSKIARAFTAILELKILIGPNYCDVSFEIDEHSGRIVIISAIDNLM